MGSSVIRYRPFLTGRIQEAGSVDKLVRDGEIKEPYCAPSSNQYSLLQI